LQLFVLQAFLFYLPTAMAS